MTIGHVCDGYVCDIVDVGDNGDAGGIGDDDKFLNANAEEGLAGYCAKHLSYATHIVW